MQKLRARPLSTTFRAVIAHDNEAKRLYRLAFPYLLKSLLTAVADNGLLIIVGQMVGTRELAALALVDLIVGHTSEAVGGVHESLITLIGYSRGANNDQLTGEYIQLAVTFYVLFSIPFLYIGAVYMEAILLFFGMDRIIAALGKGFAIPYLYARLFRGVASCLRAVLDVCELAYVSAALVGIGDVLTIGTVLAYTLLWSPSLQAIGFIILIVEFLMLFITCGLIAAKKWFQPYYCGLFQRIALTVRHCEGASSWFDTSSVALSLTVELQNVGAAQQMLRTASSLTAGNILTYGEWTILALFAGALGPAEVAAWSLLGNLWASLESFTSAIADAAEVRVALLLGSGRPNEAKLSAYKSIFIAFMFATVSTSILFLLSDEIPRWLTSDDVLRSIISELIPLVGIGNLMLTTSTLAWTIIGAQNRYQLAAALGIAGSWLVTLPLSALLTLKWRIDLQGQTAAVVIGYSVSGFVTNVVLLSSDWRMISRDVTMYNAAHDIELSDDEFDDEDSDDEDDDDSSSASATVATSELSIDV
jgi:multidrug resistance protein, MATE family